MNLFSLRSMRSFAANKSRPHRFRVLRVFSGSKPRPHRLLSSCFLRPFVAIKNIPHRLRLSVPSVVKKAASKHPVSSIQLLSALCLFVVIIIPVVAPASTTEPPTPVEQGITPPPFPTSIVETNEADGLILASPTPVVYVTNTVYIIPSNTVIRIQVRDRLDSGDWFEPVVFKSRTDYKFFRVLFETEATP
ncbi:hypothetical protein PDESU_03198 [Pontiella desulfatans]|uniref:Uncharacterized protein n=1 Tax=Pontiella desulfatans TaxID=2750659 RepID=A0A6C2U422_PONDE|nr:hypothetical protein PDESU_03198 [Pontiella desulfatans]